MSDKVSIGNIEINNSGTIGQFMKSIGIARVAAMGTVALFMIGFFAYLMTQYNKPQMTVLYSDLDFKDSVEIVKKLDGQNIPYELRGDGAVIMVPKNNVLKLRLSMAENGLPAGGAVGYEIFDKGNTLGATNFVQNINHLRALEGELSRTITALNQVSKARVHLVLPKRKLFAKDKAKASASIVIRSRGNLGSGEIRAIQHLVAAAIEGLSPAQVSVVDENGRLLASGMGAENGENPLSREVADRTRAYEARMTSELEEIVGRIVGDGHVRIRVNAEMDYNKVIKSSEVFDPDGRVVRSSNTREETASTKTPSGDKSVTIGNDLPDSNADQKANGTASESQEKTEEVINYEISKTNQTETIEGGRIKRLSVAVLIDGVYVKGADGKPEYKNRAKDEMDKIKALISSAMGFNEKRGDVVNITNLRFAATKNENLDDVAEASFFDFSKADYFYIAELIITLLISLFFILFVIRPLVRRVLEPEATEIVIDLVEHQGGDNSNQNGQASLDPSQMNTLEELEVQLADNKTAQNIQNAKANGEIQAEAIKQIGTLVVNNPKEATNVIRNWVDDKEAA